jgi:hypothetical protein
MLERLARVGYVDAAAMTSISTIDDRAWAARVLESIASDSAYRAVTAIEMLERTMGAEGQSALKRLHSRRLVRYPAAAKELARIAAEKGWAQARPAGAAPPDGVPDALRSIRLGGTDPAVQLLRQNESASQRAGANRLADSLFAIAVDSLTHRSSPSIRRAAVSALSSAARSDLPGAPFQRGPTLLLRLARVRDVEVVAMLGIARLADKRGAAGMLEAVATDNDSRATLAIDYLGRYLGDEGDRALRRLHFGRAVVFPDAARQLDRKASERRWASPSP